MFQKLNFKYYKMRDLDYLKDCPIAVLGGGAVGKTTAADCKLAGREVRLYSRSEKSLAHLEKTGILLDGIQRNLYGFERSGRSFLDVVSTDMAKVVKGAKLIVLAVPALSHEYYLKNTRSLAGRRHGDSHIHRQLRQPFALEIYERSKLRQGCDCWRLEFGSLWDENRESGQFLDESCWSEVSRHFSARSLPAHDRHG